MEIIIMNKETYRKEIQWLQKPFIAIRLGGDSVYGDNDAFPTPNNEESILPYLKGEIKILVDDVTSFDERWFEATSRNGRLFNHEHANQIKDFVAKHLNEIEVIVVHCAAEQSRSAGVGAALHRVLNGNDSVVFEDKRYTPNMWIYNTLLKEYNLVSTEETSAFNDVKRECGNCKHFQSYRSVYEDELEDSDSGFCKRLPTFEHTGIDCSCEYFERHPLI